MLTSIEVNWTRAGQVAEEGARDRAARASPRLVILWRDLRVPLTADPKFLPPIRRSRIDLNLSDRYVDHCGRSGFDLALRIGILGDSSGWDRPPDRCLGPRPGCRQPISYPWTGYLGRPRHPDDACPPTHTGRFNIRVTAGNAADARCRTGRALSSIWRASPSASPAGRHHGQQRPGRPPAGAGGRRAWRDPRRFIVAEDVAAGGWAACAGGAPAWQLDIRALYLPQPFVAPRIGAYLDPPAGRNLNHLRAGPLLPEQHRPGS